MLIALILMFIVVLVLAWFLRREQNDKTFWKTSFHQLDIGFSEVTDAYESDSLQYEDTIETLREEKHNVYEAHRLLKVDFDEQVTVIDEQAAIISASNSENLGLRNQLDIAQKIISDHDANCLPHIVLSSMEKDPPPDLITPLMQGLVKEEVKKLD